MTRASPWAVWACVWVMTTTLAAQVQGQALKGDPGEPGDLGVDLSRYGATREGRSRAKRYYLTLPYPTTLIMNNKIKIPVFSKFKNNISGAFKGFVRVVYTLPSDIVSAGRSNIDSDRLMAYNSIESIFSNLGINGRECLLKAICEVAEEPVDNYGIVGELLALILSPSHGLTTAQEELKEHCEAERYGRSAGNCNLAYSSCPFNLPDLLTSGLSLLDGSLSGFSKL
ncbi:uncharacterized protein [Procambarus clarkii]|uniref:uncharacterized protein n=1 Tax=Procambarus clarkii TaxID=6728 RepID=UPI00374466D7